MRAAFLLIATTVFAQVPFERIRDAQQKEPGSWLTYSGNYLGHRYSPLDQIRTDNVARLRVAWVHQAGGITEPFQASPIVVDGVLYITEPPNVVRAIDAKTGRTLWRYQRKIPDDLRLCCARVNRGLAILGDMVYYGSIDAHIVALEAKSGRVRWDVEMADYKVGYSSTVAPLAVKDKIVLGVAGGEFGIRGFIDAYDAKTGKRAWRFYTVAGEGEFGRETWAGDSWKTGASSIWVTGSYDAATNSILWSTGNPGPDWNGDGRKGDNLFSCTMLALDADTGQRKWHFQFTPHDVHDWDATQVPILIDEMYRGQPRKLVVTANRNGFFYVLDRENGKFLQGKPFVKQTWASGLDEAGRPMVLPNTTPTPEGNLVYPDLGGGTNWYSSSYSPITKLYYVPARETGSYYIKGEAKFEPGKYFNGGGQRPIPGEQGYGAIRALEATSGDMKWEFRMHSLPSSSLMATAGGLVFGGTSEGDAFALEARTGKPLWRFQTGGRIAANPVSYMFEGKQHIVIAGGGAMFAFTLD